MRQTQETLGVANRHDARQRSPVANLGSGGLEEGGERGRGEGRGRSKRGKEGVGGEKGGEERGKGQGDSNLEFPRWLHVLAGTCGSLASG